MRRMAAACLAEHIRIGDPAAPPKPHLLMLTLAFVQQVSIPLV